VSYSRPTVYVYLRNFVSIGLFCRPVAAKNSNFCRFLPFIGLRHLVMSPVGINLRKLSTVHNYKPSHIQRHQNRFCTPTPSWRNRAHKLRRSKASRTDRHTDGQKRFWPPRRPPRARSCASKTFGGLMHSFAARGR